MENTYELERIDLEKLPFKSSIGLISLENIKKLTLREIKSEGKGKKGNDLNLSLEILELASKPLRLPGYGGPVAAGVIIAIYSIYSVTRYTYLKIINKKIKDGISQFSASLKTGANKETIQIGNDILNLLSKIGESDKSAALKIWINYNQAVAYDRLYRKFASEQYLNSMIKYLGVVKKESEEFNLRVSYIARTNLAEARMALAILYNNAACGAEEDGNYKLARSYMATARFNGGWLGFAMSSTADRDVYTKRVINPITREIWEIIKANDKRSYELKSRSFEKAK